MKKWITLTTMMLAFAGSNAQAMTTSDFQWCHDRYTDGVVNAGQQDLAALCDRTLQSVPSAEQKRSAILLNQAIFELASGNVQSAAFSMDRAIDRLGENSAAILPATSSMP